MPFKIHLLIVSFIIGVVFLSWKWMSEIPQVSPQVASPSSAYSIIIAHASWGLNCRIRPSAAAAGDAYAGGSSSNPLRIDNVLVAVSEMCNGKVECSVPVSAQALGKDPAPECSEKMLDIEYRCFSYDRPWNAKGSSGNVAISCNRS
jgi:hypothetical protein